MIYWKEDDHMKKYLEPLYNGIIKENPTFVLMLGMCPTLAVTTSAINGMGMGLTTMTVLIMSNFVILFFLYFFFCFKYFQKIKRIFIFEYSFCFLYLIDLCVFLVL